MVDKFDYDYDYDDIEDKKGVSDLYREYAEKTELENKLEEMTNEINQDEKLIEEDKINIKDEVDEFDNKKIDDMARELNESLKDSQDSNGNKTNLVTFKGTDKGLEIYLSDDKEVDFEMILDELIKKIDSIKYVYKDFRCGIVLKGRKLLKEQEEKIVVALRKNMYVQIDYINTNDFYEDEVYKDEKDLKKDYSHTMYYHGTLRSGQSLTCKSSLVIFGDVNPGSEVTAGGNVVVMGSLRGIVQAGQRSNKAYIVAFDMNPKQLRIGDMIARAADEGDDERIKKPHMAYIKDDQIYIEPIEGTFNLIEKGC